MSQSSVSGRSPTVLTLPRQHQFVRCSLDAFRLDRAAREKKWLVHLRMCAWLPGRHCIAEVPQVTRSRVSPWRAEQIFCHVQCHRPAAKRAVRSSPETAYCVCSSHNKTLETVDIGLRGRGHLCETKVRLLSSPDRGVQALHTVKGYWFMQDCEASCISQSSTRGKCEREMGREEEDKITMNTLEQLFSHQILPT